MAARDLRSQRCKMLTNQRHDIKLQGYLQPLTAADCLSFMQRETIRIQSARPLSSMANHGISTFCVNQFVEAIVVLDRVGRETEFK